MKLTLATILVLVGVFVTQAAYAQQTYHYFEFYEDTGALVADAAVEADEQPSYSSDAYELDADLNKKVFKKRYRVFVTKAEFESGHEAVSISHKDACKELAQAERTDIDEQFDSLLKSFALVVLDEINTLRDAAGLQERSVQQLKQAVRAKYESLQ